nr:MAG: 1,4-dihydroxy-2-naphthoate polyprenyltransferase [Bacillota bacterium]
MALKNFLEFVEIRTKVASFIPFLLGAVFSLYRYGSFNWKNFHLMLVSLLSIDMATTAINNYIDYKKTNAAVTYQMDENTAKRIIILLLSAAVTFGLLLFINTDIVVLILGAVSFTVGVFYTYGPLPISRMPLGEVFSGFFMGFVIIFLSVYINALDQKLVQVFLDRAVLSVNLKIAEIIYIFLFSIPAVNGIANIMLANNICDMENDAKNRRYTLPVYLGKERALKLFKYLYLIIYLDLLLVIALKIVPVYTAATLITALPVHKNIEKFAINTEKNRTFVLAVRNFIMINVAYMSTILLGLIWP